MPRIIPEMPPARLAGGNGVPEISTEAQRLYLRGYWVVPCAGKQPTVKGWNEKRLTRSDLHAALDANPTLNIAIVLSQSELIDVECDSEQAETTLTQLVGGELAPTPTWRSKRGKHRLFRRPPGLPEKAKLELDGIEFRIGNGKGALSVVPPSVHESGVRYEWEPGLSIYDLEPAELPPAVAERLRAPAPPPSPDLVPGAPEIPEGERNDTLFQKACMLRDLKLPEATVLTTLLDLNQRLCKPPLPEGEVRSIVASAAKGEARAGTFLTRLLGEIELWHDENDDPFVTLPQDDHRENWKIGKRATAFRRWLSKKHYEATGRILGASDLADLASLLEGKAVFDGLRYTLFRRTAEQEGKFYLDLCDEKWRAVEIDAAGWQVVSDPPVKFRRAKGMLPLPIPLKCKTETLKQLLLPFLNVKTEQWPLVAAWLAAAIRPRGPYPLLKLLGEQGSAKTTTARVLRASLDPNAAPVRAEPRDARDLMIAANNGWVICLDNLSHLPPWLSDALCRMATGGGFATRTLYTDEDETIFDSQRPVILTSIDEIGMRSDLLERSLIIELPTIREGKRQAEKAFWLEFEKARSMILGALLDVVSCAIRRLPEIERKPNTDLSRMADFEQWGEACEQALGLDVGTFADAYRANRETATQVAIESSSAVAALLQLLNTKPYIEETAVKLLEQLIWMDSARTKAPDWPKTPRVLSQILGRVAPNLRQIGIVAEKDTRGGGKTKEKIWRIQKATVAEVPAKAAAPVPHEPKETNWLAVKLQSLGVRLVDGLVVTSEGPSGSQTN